MTGGGIGLDAIESAYRRISRAAYRAVEEAYDFVAEEIISALEQDQAILDAAFFILVFGQLERRIDQFAGAIPQPQPLARGRQKNFGSRLGTALPGKGQRLRRREIEQWYALRNRAAHGEEIAAGYNLRAIIARARELEAELGSG